MAGKTLMNSQPPARVAATAWSALSMPDFCCWVR